MGTGYTRNDTVNNIADGNVINAADLDGEFDAIESAFNSSTGHTHDGTSAEGGAVTVLGPSQEFVANATEVTPSSNAALSLGTAALQFNNLYVDGKAYIDGIGESTLVDTDFKIQFRDTALFINSSVDGQLDLQADTLIELTAPTVSLTNDLKLKSDSAVLTFGADDDTTLTHTDGLGLTLNSTNKLAFGDSASFVQQSSDGVLRIDGEATINLNASTAVTVSNDLKLNSDAAVLSFGADDDVTVTHVADTGLDLKAANGFDLNLQTADTTVESGNTIGKITFNAPNEASGTDAVLVGAAITALAEATFDSATNSTALVFSTNTSAAATERVRITSAGDVGIGTNTPSAKLDVVGGVEITGEIDIDNININGNTIISTNTNGNIDLTPNGTGEVNITKVDINGGTIDGTVIGGSTPAAISGTTGSFSGNLTVDTNTLFVDAANNRVGVGTASPTENLDVRAASGNVTIQVQADGTTASDNAILRLSIAGTVAESIIHLGDADDSNVGQLRYDHATDFMSFQTAASERMRIDSSGNVGIGTTSPAYPLDVVGTVRIAHAGTDTFSTLRGPASRSLRVDLDANGDTDSLDVRDLRDGSVRFTVQAGGNVGIGTTSPADRLHVYDGSSGIVTFATNTDLLIEDDGNAAIQFATPNTQNQQILFSDPESNTAGIIQYSHSADEMTFNVNGSQRVVINSSGNVGIGTSSPSRPLHVIGNTRLEAAGTAFVSLAMANTNGTTDEKNVDWLNNSTSFSLRLLNDASSAGRTAYNVIRSGYTPTTHQWYTAASGTPSERMRIDSSGNVGIGETNPSQALDVVGSIEVSGGIYLGGTTSANLLDDYEEGTWTAEVYDAATGGNASATTATGQYTKVGRMVTASASLSNINTSGMTGANDLYFTLPFAVGTGFFNGSVRTGGVAVDAAIASLSSYADTSDTRARIVESRDNLTNDLLIVSEVASGTGDIMFTITYFTA